MNNDELSTSNPEQDQPNPSGHTRTTSSLAARTARSQLAQAEHNGEDTGSRFPWPSVAQRLTEKRSASTSSADRTSGDAVRVSKQSSQLVGWKLENGSHVPPGDHQRMALRDGECVQERLRRFRFQKNALLRQIAERAR
jgi:hypothetical protein